VRTPTFASGHIKMLEFQADFKGPQKSDVRLTERRHV
jgi:hypothetical protein